MRRAGREECRTSFCSNRSKERRVQQLSGSREERREQCVETLPRGGEGRGGEGRRISIQIISVSYWNDLQVPMTSYDLI